MRELRNTLERAMMLSDRALIDARALAPFIGPARGAGGGVGAGGGAGAGGVGPAAVAVAAQTAMADTRAAASSYADAFAAWERQFLIDALAASNGKVTEAAARIGIGRATFYKKLATLGIDT
ncbi:sensory box protein/sigma-54 dependent transcriptional regulator [Burkholderia pseudomallei 1106b]|nr:sensory box protein/sigma-54 dependent transcriptional regulator [Burkholderia pseudomallei 1106b]